MAYSIDYWIKKGYSAEHAKQRTEGKEKCVVCGNYFGLKDSPYKGIYLCSEQCKNKSNDIRIEKYKASVHKKQEEDFVHCEQCNKLMKKKSSVMTDGVMICSDSCRKARKQAFPKKLTVICIEYWEKLGYSQEEAKEIISDIQKERSKRSIIYWLKQGFTEEESKKLVSQYQTDQNKNNLCNVQKWIDDGYDLETAKVNAKNMQEKIVLGVLNIG